MNSRPKDILRAPGVHAERVAMVYRDALPGMLGSLFASTVILVFELAGGSFGEVLAWYTVLCTSTASRFWLIRQYRLRVPQAGDAALWGRRFLLATLSAGIAWAILAAWLVPAQHEGAYLLSAILVVILAVPLASLATIRLAYYCFAFPVATAFAVSRIVSGDPSFVLVGWSAVVVMMVLGRIAARTERNAAEAIWTRLEAQALVQRLGEENGRVLASQRELEAEIARRESAELDMRAHRRRLDLMISQTPVACVSWSVEFNISSWNPAAERVFGFPAAEVLGRNAFEVFTPAHVRGTVERRWRDWLAGRGPVPDGVLKGVTKQGAGVVCEWFNTPLLDEKGGIVEIVSLVVDVTARRQAESALAQAKERLDLALRASNVALWEWEVSLDRWRADERFGRMLGHEGEVATSTRALQALGHPDDNAELQRRLGGVLAGYGDVLMAEQRVRAADDRWVWLEIVGKVVLRDAGGRAVRMSGTISDITAHKRAQAELEEARQAAEQANRAKSQFLANMSHEIRTPMNGVLGMLELLRSSSLDHAQRRFAETADASARSLLGIINDILDFSKIEAGKLDLESIAFDPALAVGEAVSMFESRAEAKGLRLDMIVAEGVPPAVQGDPLRLRQVITNLVANAIKFTASGEVSVRLAAHVGMGIEVTVRDTGIGMTPEVQQRLFRPFSQADGSTTRQFGGTGLGLAIARELVQLMNGRIELASEPGRGSTFAVHLPLPPALEPVRRLSFRPVTMSMAAIRSYAGCQVVLAEDNPVNRDVAEALLARFGVAVVVATNGVEAVDAVSRGGCDLVLMDCQMPELDGLAATRRIREAEHARGVGEDQQPRRRLPIVALTANAMKGDRERCLAAGMDDYLAKPFSAAQLGEVLERWLVTAEAGAGVDFDLKEMIAPIEAAELVAALDPEDCLDRAMLDNIRAASRADGDELVSRVVRRYLEDAPRLIGKMRAAQADGDAQAQGRSAHSLKSASATVGARRLAGLCRDVEERARQSHATCGGAALDSIERAFEAAADALKEEVGAAVGH